jgi:hypothetical protein
MTDQQTLARVYHVVQSWFVKSGRAPHFTELATEFGVDADRGLELQNEMLEAIGGPHWADPESRLIACFDPFSNIPTQYRISIDGEQKWYGE